MLKVQLVSLGVFVAVSFSIGRVPFAGELTMQEFDSIHLQESREP
jgi:hypothetical protein